jgi:hypothetical protein
MFHSLALDMTSFFSTGLFWSSKSRVRHRSFLDLQAQHFKMQLAESAELQAQLVESSGDQSKIEFWEDNNQEDGDVEEARDLEDHDADDEVGALQEQPENNEAQPNIRRTLNAI